MGGLNPAMEFGARLNKGWFLTFFKGFPDEVDFATRWNGVGMLKEWVLASAHWTEKDCSLLRQQAGQPSKKLIENFLGSADRTAVSALTPRLRASAMFTFLCFTFSIERNGKKRIEASSHVLFPNKIIPTKEPFPR